MKIAYLLHRFPGKTDTFIKREIEGLRKLGANVEVISIWRPKENESTPEIMSDWSDLTITLLPNTVGSSLRSLFSFAFRHPTKIFKAFSLANKTSPPGLRSYLYQCFYFIEAILAASVIEEREFTHLHNHFGDQSGNVAMFAAELSDVQFSISYHGPHVFFEPYRWAIDQKVKRASFSRAISYFCRSQLMLFSQTIDGSSIKIVHCGIDPDKFEFLTRTNKLKTLFCSARLAPEKGLSVLFHAVKELRSRGFDINLRLAGDGISKTSLERVVSELGLKDSVSFLGFLNQEQIYEELRGADIFVLPSFAEGLPVSLMEAMAVGLPVVATNVAATWELVRDRETGLLVQPSNVNSLVNAIEQLLTEKDLVDRLTLAARKMIEEEFHIEKECQKLLMNFEASAYG